MNFYADGNFRGGTITGDTLDNLKNLEHLDFGEFWEFPFRHGHSALLSAIRFSVCVFRLLTMLSVYPHFDELDNIGLGGRIPIEIGNLRKLTHLDLDGNELSGQIPSQIGLLTNLVTLDIGT